MGNMTRPDPSIAYTRHTNQAATLLQWIGDDLHSHEGTGRTQSWDRVAELARMKRHLVCALSILAGIPEAEIEDTMRDIQVPPAPAQPATHAEGDLLADPKRLLTQDEAARALNVRPNTLINWRCTKRHTLPYLRVGRLTRYRAGDIVKWLQQRTVTPIDIGI